MRRWRVFPVDLSATTSGRIGSDNERRTSWKKRFDDGRSFRGSLSNPTQSSHLLLDFLLQCIDLSVHQRLDEQGTIILQTNDERTFIFSFDFKISRQSLRMISLRKGYYSLFLLFNISKTQFKHWKSYNVAGILKFSFMFQLKPRQLLLQLIHFILMLRHRTNVDGIWSNSKVEASNKYIRRFTFRISTDLTVWMCCRAPS